MCGQPHAPAVLNPDNNSLDKIMGQQHKRNGCSNGKEKIFPLGNEPINFTDQVNDVVTGSKLKQCR
jgi:hypothetical protein